MYTVQRRLSLDVARSRAVQSFVPKKKMARLRPREEEFIMWKHHGHKCCLRKFVSSNDSEMCGLSPSSFVWDRQGDSQASTSTKSWS